MLPTLTIYTVSADVTLLNTILNGVAMVCQQNMLIWGFAMLAALWRITATTTKATIEASKGGAGGGVLAHGSISAVMPFVFAMLLTNPMLQTKVQVESTINGKVTVIDHVPLVIGILPSAASTLSQETGAVIETANQGTGTDYASISASGNGFINPLKVLLTSRTAVMRLGGLESQVKSVVSSCLGTDSGINYGALNAAILNAGNTGATAAQSLPVSDISGNAPTGIGALLKAAANNDTGYVADLTSDGSILSCSDAADLVASNINTTLNSAEFGRVVQGAATGMDEPNPASDTSISALFRQYSAIRNANTTFAALGVASNQAGAELINLVMYELVTSSLNCLKADSMNKVACEAGAAQVNEMERNNLQAAASTLPMLKYAGNFANYMMALVIGLGPVIIMFMMFSGVDSGKNIKTAAHVMIWPLLVINVGAELVNGMIYQTVANFLTSLSQGGYVSPALAIEAYKELGLQVGTASQIMASLPIIMSMIFVLGESSALVGVANNLTPKGNNTAELAAPTITAATPLMQQSPMAVAAQAAGFTSVKGTGASSNVAGSVTMGTLTNEASSTNTSARTQQKNLSEGEQNVADWKEAFSKGDYSKFGIDKRTGESIRKSYEQNTQEAENQSTARGNHSTTQNTNNSSAGVNAGGGFGVGGGKLGFSFNAGGSAQTTTGAQDTLQADTKTAKDRSVRDSQALSKAISAETGKTTTTSTGNDKTHQLQKSLATQSTYQKTLSELESNTDATSKANKENETFVRGSAAIGDSEIAQHRNTNGEYGMQQVVEGKQFSELPALQKHMATAQKDMASGTTAQMFGNNAREAVLLHRSAVMLAQDKTASPEDRFKAGEFLEHSVNAMQHMPFQSGDTSMRTNQIEAPKDRTGVNPMELKERINPPAPAPKPAANHARKQMPTKPHTPSSGTKPTFPDKVPEAIPDSMGASVRAEVAAADQIGKNAGLGAYGDGTVKRTAANVVDNIKDTRRQLGTPSNVSVGDLSAEAQRQQKQRVPRPEDQIPK